MSTRVSRLLPVFCCLIVTLAGCTQSPVPGAQVSGQPSPAEQELLRRITQMQDQIQRLEDLNRRTNAELGMQLDAVQARIAALDSKVAAQDRLLSRAVSALSGAGAAGGTGLPEGPRAQGPVARLDDPDSYAADAEVRIQYAPQSPLQPVDDAAAVIESVAVTGGLTVSDSATSAGTAAAPGAAGSGSGQPAVTQPGVAPAGTAPSPAARPGAAQPGAQQPVADEPLDLQEMRAGGDLGTLIPEPPEEGRRRYETAYRDLQRENYQLALINFRAFLQAYPETRLSDNAQYWIGEVYYAQGQFQQAVEEFRKVIEVFGGQDKVPAAYYKIALCFINLRDVATARRYLEYVVEHFPDTREAQLAGQKLGEL